jgi:hypothetical protein
LQKKYSEVGLLKYELKIGLVEKQKIDMVFLSKNIALIAVQN